MTQPLTSSPRPIRGVVIAVLLILVFFPAARSGLLHLAATAAALIAGAAIAVFVLAPTGRRR